MAADFKNLIATNSCTYGQNPQKISAAKNNVAQINFAIITTFIVCLSMHEIILLT